jgi:hypothetical protein
VTKPTPDANVRRLVLVMAALTAVLVSLFGPGTASSAEAPGAQIRVGLHTPRAQVVVGTHGGIDAARRLESSPSTYDSVLASGVAAENPVAAALGLVPEYNHNDAAPGYDASILFVGARTVVQVEVVGRHAPPVYFQGQTGAMSDWSVAVAGFGVAAKTGDTLLSAGGGRARLPMKMDPRVTMSGEVNMSGDDGKPMKEYQGLIWIGDDPGIRVRYLARSGEEAEGALIAEYGAGHVFTCGMRRTQTSHAETGATVVSGPETCAPVGSSPSTTLFRVGPGLAGVDLDSRHRDHRLGSGPEGRRDEATLVAQSLLSAAEAFDYHLPELYAGASVLDRPVPYPASCRPQAWSAASAAVLISVALGFEPDAAAGRYTLRPARPAAYGQMTVSGLRFAGHSFGVRCAPDGSSEVLDAPEGVDIQVAQPLPTS